MTTCSSPGSRSGSGAGGGRGASGAGRGRGASGAGGGGGGGAGNSAAGAAAGERLRLARIARRLSQQQLAAQARVSRQAVAGIEAGSFDPSLKVALALALALDSSVESLFAAPPAKPREAVVALRADGRTGVLAVAGERVQLARVGERVVALPLSADGGLRAGFAPASGTVLDHRSALGIPAPKSRAASAPSQGSGTPGRASRPGRAGSMAGDLPARTSLVLPTATIVPRLVVAGCDPALALVAGALEDLQRHTTANSATEPARPIAFTWLACSSERALELLDAGLVHAAGVHLPEHGGRVPPGVSTICKEGGSELVGFARWQEGLAFRQGTLDGPTPGREQALLEQLAHHHLRLVNRELGAEARSLLDARLLSAGVPPGAVFGYETEVRAHLLVASSIASGLGDVGITTEPAAAEYGLGFVALEAERSLIVLARPLLETLEVRALVKVLTSEALRAQLQLLRGYDASECGQATSWS